MREEQLVCRGITKNYKDTEALQGIDLTLEKGKIYGLIGRNGAGKTTLLSILTAQNPPTEGSVLLNGTPVWENQEMLDRMCFSREINTTIGFGANTMKVKEYLRIASIYLPRWDKQMEQRLLKEFKLDVKKAINKLSKGMLSMVTVIVALASKAEFTFLDEPVAGLDVVAREHFYKVLLDEYTNTDRTFVISTHIIEEAADVFEEVIIMNEGRVLLKENTQELLERTYLVSGKAEEVEKAVSGLKTYHVRNIGRKREVTVMLKENERISKNHDVEVNQMSLQKVFVSLCGEEEQS